MYVEGPRMCSCVRVIIDQCCRCCCSRPPTQAVLLKEICFSCFIISCCSGGPTKCASHYEGTFDDETEGLFCPWLRRALSHKSFLCKAVWGPPQAGEETSSSSDCSFLKWGIRLKFYTKTFQWPRKRNECVTGAMLPRTAVCALCYYYCVFSLMIRLAGRLTVYY